MQDETKVHIICECEALASLILTYLGSSFLDPEDIKSTRLGPSVTLAKENGSPELVSDYGAQTARF